MSPLDHSHVGRRVVIRYRLSEPVSGAHATDVIGTLTGWEAETLRVRTASGQLVNVATADVIAARPVPPRTVARRDIRDLEAAAASGWQALTTERIGGWLLRAAGGFTGRANSCLPLDEPGRPLARAVDDVERWYDERSLRPAFQVPTRLGTALDAQLDARGWPSAAEDVIVMTAPLATIAAEVRPDLPAPRVADLPDDEWLAAYHYRGGTLPDVARDVLVNADQVGFASVDEAGQPVAVARGAVSDAPSGRRWLGVTAVEVAPGHRRRGLGTHIVAALAAWADRFDATGVYLQVASDNLGALGTYERLGFVEHHRYHYRRHPGPTAARS